MAVRDQNKKQKKENILRAAALVFSQKGFSRALVANIALTAGVGKGTVYEYFDSKEALFLAVFEWYMNQMAAEARVSLSAIGGTASARLAALSEAVMAAGKEMEDMFTLFMEFWAAGSPDRFRGKISRSFQGLYGDIRQLVAGLIRDGQIRGEFAGDVDAEAVAATMVGAWDGLLLQNWLEINFDPMVASRNFTTVLLRGLQADLSAHPRRSDPETVT